jgi:hypothetical protein
MWLISHSNSCRTRLMTKTIARRRLAAEGAFFELVSGSKLELWAAWIHHDSVNPLFRHFARLVGPASEGILLGDDRGKMLARRSLLQRGTHLGFDGTENLESWRAARLDFSWPSSWPQWDPNKRPEDWATKIASGELDFQDGNRSDQTRTQRVPGCDVPMPPPPVMVPIIIKRSAAAGATLLPWDSASLLDSSRQ